MNKTKQKDVLVVTWKLDPLAVRYARAAAALQGKGIQEYVSECLMACASNSPGLTVPAPSE